MIGGKRRRLKTRIIARVCVAVLAVALNSTFAFGAEDPVAGQHDFAVRCASCHGTTIGEKKIGRRSPGCSDMRAAAWRASGIRPH